MQVEIKEVMYDLHFGLKFIHKLDESKCIKRNGMEFGYGVNYALNLLD